MQLSGQSPEIVSDTGVAMSRHAGDTSSPPVGGHHHWPQAGAQHRPAAAKAAARYANRIAFMRRLPRA